MSDSHTLARWRLVLGKVADQHGISCAGQADAVRIEQLVGFLFERADGQGSGGGGGRSSDDRTGSLGPSQMTVPSWVDAVNELFPQQSREVMQKELVRRRGIAEIMEKPELLEKIEPNLDLVKTLLTHRELLNPRTRILARKIIDKVVGAKNTAGEYEQNRGLADKPEDIVVVPLKYQLPPTKLRKFLHMKGKEKDFSGLGSGTLNFDMTEEEKTMLSTLTEQATKAHIEKRREPKTTEFKTEDQMLMCIGRDDLASMAKSDFKGAKDALAFRDLVVDTIGGMIGRVKQLRGQDVPVAQIADDDTVKNGLALLETQAGDSVDRQGFVGRELNRTDDLEGVLAAVPQDRRDTNTFKAGKAVSEKLRAQDVAKNILKNVVYPKLVRQDPKGSGAEILKQMDAILRAAQSPDDVNDALDIGIRHFKTKSDKRGVHGHAEFAQSLEELLMKTD